MDPRIEEGDSLAIFVDSGSLRAAIRWLFNEDEFDSADYIPRTANWYRLFFSIAKLLGASRWRVFWYTIGELDFEPFVEWEKIDLNWIENDDFYYWKKKLLDTSEYVRKEYRRQRDFANKKRVINNQRRRCFRYQQTMQDRLEGWIELQDSIAREIPVAEIDYSGWQLVNLMTGDLEEEKAVDVAMAIDLVVREDEYDTAVLFTQDGDFVPAVRAMRKRGKKIGNIEYLGRDGRKMPGAARRLTENMDFVFELPFEEMAAFMDIEVTA